MRSFSLALVFLVGALLSEADAYRRRSAEDRDFENLIDTSRESSEQRRYNERPRHHQHHHHRSSSRRHRFANQVQHATNISQAEQVIEMHRFFIRDCRRLATEAGMRGEDINSLLNIFEENRPVFRSEDRSHWTEEQWQKDEEQRIQRETLTKALAFEAIQDHAHLAEFFMKLETQKKKFKEDIRKHLLAELVRIAKRTGLNEAQIEKFTQEVDSHKPVGIHWRPGMSENEKKKNLDIYTKNWQKIKEACLQDVDEIEQAQFNKFFVAVEEDFANRSQRNHRPRHHHRHHHRRHFHQRNPEDDEAKPESRFGLRHRRPSSAEDEVEEVPRRHFRHHHRRQFEVEDVDERRPRHSRRNKFSEENDEDKPRRRHRHSEESDEQEDFPRRHHRRHYRPENSEESEEQRDMRDGPHHHRHHRHHHRRHFQEAEENEDSKESRVRPEPMRMARKHYRRDYSAEY